MGLKEETVSILTIEIGHEVDPGDLGALDAYYTGDGEEDEERLEPELKPELKPCSDVIYIHIYDDGWPLCYTKDPENPGLHWKSGSLVRQHVLATCPDCLGKKP